MPARSSAVKAALVIARSTGRAPSSARDGWVRFGCAPFGTVSACHPAVRRGRCHSVAGRQRPRRGIRLHGTAATTTDRIASVDMRSDAPRAGAAAVGQIASISTDVIT